MHAVLPPDLEQSSLCDALSISDPSELVSIVGGGGKSALLFALARDLPGRTIITTTTRIFAAQTARATEWHRIGTPECDEALGSERGGVLVIGDVEGDKAKGVAVEAPFSLLCMRGVDFVVVEADGSRMLPAKAPASHEPVVPVETTLFVAVAGIDALRGPIGKTCHRPERVASLLGVSEEDWLDSAGLAELLCHKDGGLKNVPESARVALFINKIENSDQWKAGRALAAVARVHPRVERVVLGALEPSTKGASEGEVGHDAGFEVFLGASSDKE